MAVVGVALAGLTFGPVAADRAWPQEPGPDDAQAQEAWSRILEEQGPSHASGQRPELGPVILGNPTEAVVVIRVGLYYSYTATGACVGDYDNDGHDDLFVTYWGKSVLYHNNGDGTFTDVSERAGVAGSPKRWSAG